MHRRIALILLMTAIFPLSTFAQQVVISSPFLLYRPAVNDLRAKGMGNTEILSPDPVNGGLSNPALFVDHVGIGLSLGMNNLSGGNEIERLNQGSSVYYRINHEGNINGKNTLSYVSFISTLQDELLPAIVGFGISYQQLYSAYKMERNELILNYHGDQVITYTSNYNQKERYRFISPTFAFKIKSFSMGLAINIGVRSNDNVNEYDYIQQWSYYNYSTDSTSSEIYTERDNGVKPSEFITIGAKYAYKNLKVGFIYRGRWSTESEDFGMPLDLPPYYVYTKLFKNYHRFPAILGFGLSYSPMDNLTLVSEYQTRTFSLNNTSQKGIEDGDVKRFGVEYIPLEDVFIRAGYFQESIMVFDYNSESPEVLTGFTAGLGIKKSFVTVDLALEYGNYEQILDGSSLLNDYAIRLKNTNRILTVGSSITLHF